MSRAHVLQNHKQISLAGLSPPQREKATELLMQINSSFELLTDITSELTRTLSDLAKITGPHPMLDEMLRTSAAMNQALKGPLQ